MLCMNVLLGRMRGAAHCANQHEGERAGDGRSESGHEIDPRGCGAGDDSATVRWKRTGRATRSYIVRNNGEAAVRAFGAAIRSLACFGAQRSRRALVDPMRSRINRTINQNIRANGSDTAPW